MLSVSSSSIRSGAHLRRRRGHHPGRWSTCCTRRRAYRVTRLVHAVALGSCSWTGRSGDSWARHRGESGSSWARDLANWADGSDRSACHHLRTFTRHGLGWSLVVNGSFSRVEDRWVLRRWACSHRTWHLGLVVSYLATNWWWLRHGLNGRWLRSGNWESRSLWPGALRIAKWTRA